MEYPCANAFRVIRKSNNLSQAEFAEKLAVSASHIGQIEQGRSVPSYELMLRVVETFSNADAHLFFGGGKIQTVIDNSFYKLISDMSQEQLDGIRELLKLVTNVSIQKEEIPDGRGRKKK